MNAAIAEREAMHALNVCFERLSAGRVAEAMRDCFASLDLIRASISAADWRNVRAVCREHPVRPLLLHCPLTRRSVQKPRGYPGDAVLLDYLYGFRPALSSALGREIFTEITKRPLAEGVRLRLIRLRSLLEDVADQFPRPRVCALACGHLREAEIIRSKGVAIGRLLAYDHDPQTADVVRESFAGWPIEANVLSVRDYLNGRGLQTGQHLVYASGLFDYLTDRTASALIRRMFEALAPGGSLFVANAATNQVDAGYMEFVMEWFLLYRTREDMQRIASAALVDVTAQVVVETDAVGAFHYVSIVKQ